MYEIFGRMSVTKITFAYYELMELPDQYFGDFNLGSAYSRAGLWEAFTSHQVGTMPSNTMFSKLAKIEWVCLFMECIPLNENRL
jgi:hypothetical protein